MKNFEKLTNDLKKFPRLYSEYWYLLRSNEELKYYEMDSIEDGVMTLCGLGFPVEIIQNRRIALKTVLTPIEEQKICVVDIETNGSKPTDSQIIEIGAIMLQNGEEIGRFESKVYANQVPSNITKVTGLRAYDLRNAPPLNSVLEKFRLFLGDALFVAHNVNFDYDFISYGMNKAGFGVLLNRKLCTIELARKTIEAQRYGLGYLIGYLGIDVSSRHRALDDAIAASEILKLSIANLKEREIIADLTTEALIDFSKQSLPKKKREKITEAKIYKLF